MTAIKQVLGVYGPGASYSVGDGFPVRNLFPSNDLGERLSPFLLLDYAGPAYFPPTNQPRGVDEHPHRGFETVTVVYQGRLEHRDSAGNQGTIGPGDVQWMTAASGVVHEEKHASDFARTGGTLQMVQLWVNLPRAHKMSAPRYQSLTCEQIPVIELPASGGQVRVIAGQLRGVVGPAKTFTPVGLFDLRLKEGQEFEFEVPEGHNTAVVCLAGRLRVNGTDPALGEAEMAVLDSRGQQVLVQAEQEALVLVLDGEPIFEPVVARGPFVMNTREEIVQASEDYRTGKMGRLGP